MLRLVRERMAHSFVIGSDFVNGPLERVAAGMPNVPLLRFDLTHCQTIVLTL